MRGADLRSGQVKSCGCLVVERSREVNGIDRTGKRYGKLTALEIEENSLSKGIYWKCLCECGNYTSVLGSNLASGAVKSCGCIKNSYGEEVILNLLLKNKVDFVKEYTFPDLTGIGGGVLRFDFAIFDENKKLIQLIEYDGEQHYKESSIWGGKEGLLNRQENDKRKN